MNKKKLGVFVSATLGLISCVCVLPKISVYAQGNFMRVFNPIPADFILEFDILLLEISS